MKKFLFSVTLSLLLFSATACRNNNDSENNIAETEQNTTISILNENESEDIQNIEENSQETQNSNILIVYFSMPEDVNTDGVNAVAGASIVMSEGEKLGNVQYIAQIIQQNIGGELFRIETVQDYPLEHSVLVEQASNEQSNHVRPELKAFPENIEEYDTIFIGYPNWWGDMPMPLYTFLEKIDLSGKTIIPFCPHGGSRFSRTLQSIEEIQPNAEVSQNGFTISRDDVVDSKENIIAWLQNLSL